MIVDGIIAVILLFGFYKGFKTGLVKSILSFIAVLVGLYAGLELINLTSVYVEKHLNVQSTWVPLISFILVFIGLILLVQLIAYCVDKFMKIILLGWTNKLAGGFLGLSLALILVSGLMWLGNQISLFPPELKSKSVLFTYTENVYPVLMGNLPLIKEAFWEIEQIFHRYVKL